MNTHHVMEKNENDPRHPIHAPAYLSRAVDMNLVDCYVTEIIGEPYEAYGRWWQKVRYESWGAPSTSELMFSTKAEAESVVIGHHFLA